MDKVKLIRPEKVNLNNHPILNETWLREVSATADRNYWKNTKGTPKTVKIVDEILSIVTDIIPGYKLSI